METKITGQTLYIRADADRNIGMGHVMRCIALGQRWMELGGKVSMLTSCRIKEVNRRVLEEGFELVQIPEPFPDNSDVIVTMEYICEKGDVGSDNAPWLIADGYHFSPEYHKRIRNAGIRLMIIDDMAHLPEYNADILLNQNIHADNFKYICDEDAIRLLGQGYSLLRAEFLKYRSFERKIPERVRNILVTLGGADKDNITVKVINALKQFEKDDLAIRVVAGHSNIHKEELNHSIYQIPARFQVLSSVKEMPSLMAWADMAISACGSTCYELAFMGLPSVLLTVAENQNGIGERFHREGAALHIGSAKGLDRDAIYDAVNSLLFDQSRREIMHGNCIRLVDGSGVTKIVEIINSFSPAKNGIEKYLRRADKNDCHPIWLLANDPVVRKNSFSNNAIAFEDHCDWYNDKLVSNKSCIFVLDIDGQIGGQIRYEKEDDYAVINFSVAPAFRGKGFGRKMIDSTVKDVCEIFQVSSVRGLVKIDNTPSVISFAKSGFERVGSSIISGTECIIFEKKVSKNNKQSKSLKNNADQ